MQYTNIDFIKKLNGMQAILKQKEMKNQSRFIESY